MQPSIQDAMKMAEDLSWDDFEAIGQPKPVNEAARRAADAKRAELAGVAARIYHTPDGRRFFKFLADVTLFRSGFITTMGYEPMVAYGEQCRRDGQCTLVSQLLKLAAEGGARDAPATPSDPGKEDGDEKVLRTRVRPSRKVRASGAAGA